MNTANIISYFIVALLRSDLWNEETGNNKRKKKPSEQNWSEKIQLIQDLIPLQP